MTKIKFPFLLRQARSVTIQLNKILQSFLNCINVEYLAKNIKYEKKYDIFVEKCLKKQNFMYFCNLNIVLNYFNSIVPT
ncbi:MAG: hypothetical protein BWY08_01320 [Bacteroidetes bacterium ADurb.Bin174]|nr:MAG: hypothetical protein BWY08_01320 [Bacteroidetes bacterium ADurb.Bin174]